jgi:hypothetical protein
MRVVDPLDIPPHHLHSRDPSFAGSSRSRSSCVGRAGAFRVSRAFTYRYRQAAPQAARARRPARRRAGGRGRGASLRRAVGPLRRGMSRGRNQRNNPAAETAGSPLKRTCTRRFGALRPRE